MGPLTDIQDNIEKLRSLQESLHDLCTFISTLDLTSGAKEETLIHGITELKEAFVNIDLSSVEQAQQMLSALELYALDCYRKTEEHKMIINALSVIEEVERYDVIQGYPEQLRLEL